MMMIGMIIAGIARVVALLTSERDARGMVLAPARGARNQVTAIIEMPAMMPGMAPPRNRAPIETPVTEP